MKRITIEGKDYELRWFFRQISENQKDMLVDMGLLERLG